MIFQWVCLWIVLAVIVAIPLTKHLKRKKKNYYRSIKYYQMDELQKIQYDLRKYIGKVSEN